MGDGIGKEEFENKYNVMAIEKDRCYEKNKLNILQLQQVERII